MVNTIHVLPVAAGCLLQLVTVGTKNSDWRFNDVSHCRLYTLCAREAIHYLLYLYRSPPPFLSILPPAHPPTSPSLHTAARRRPAVLTHLRLPFCLPLGLPLFLGASSPSAGAPSSPRGAPTSPCGAPG